jgi:hypothetical protein
MASSWVGSRGIDGTKLGFDDAATSGDGRVGTKDDGLGAATALDEPRLAALERLEIVGMTANHDLSRGAGLRQGLTHDVDDGIGALGQLATENPTGNPHRQHPQILLDIFVGAEGLNARGGEKLGDGSQAPLAPFGDGLVAQPLSLVTRFAEDFFGFRSRVERIRINRRLFSVAKTAF